MKLPSLPDLAVRSTPVSSRRSRIVAPDMRCCCASTTVPTIAPVSTWASATALQDAMNTKKREMFLSKDNGPPEEIRRRHAYSSGAQDARKDIASRLGKLEEGYLQISDNRNNNNRSGEQPDRDQRRSSRVVDYGKTCSIACLQRIGRIVRLCQLMRAVVFKFQVALLPFGVFLCWRRAGRFPHDQLRIDH